ncbi:MAG: thiamine pyrophosphate-binding protein [Proteobacteria bacterium]|nr:thiamine pyrophosphate-binding protein [Pseudomonadota bacterium]
MQPTPDRKAGATTGARALVDALLREGVDHVFGIPGTQNLAILDALRETPQIRFILTRHEQGAAFMAYGFARAAQRPGVVTATEGPGVTNLATGIGAAYRGMVPVISICGVQESAMRERDATQDMDQVTFMRPITKWAYSIPNVQKVQESVRKAFRVALTEPQGPAHIEAASEILLESCASEATAPAAYRNTQLPSCTSAQLDEVHALLAVAKRPVFVVGRGLISEAAGGAMAALATRTGIPVGALQYSPDAFASTHAFALGPLGRNGSGAANRILPQADLIIAIGAHFDVFSTQYKYGMFSKDAKIVHHSAAPGQIGIVFPVTLGVTGSTRSFIEGLAERVNQSGINKAWVDVAKACAEWETELQGVVRTAMRENIPVVYVVFNDQGLGNERAFQNEHYGGRFFAVDYNNPDFGALARVFGAHGEHVTRPADLEPALRRAFASGKPAIVDVMIDKNTLAPVVFRP